MSGSPMAALLVVAADEQAGLSVDHRSPGYAARALAIQLRDALDVGRVIAVAQEDDAIGFVGVFVFGSAVVAELLE